MFQFPSNGKAYPKNTTCRWCRYSGFEFQFPSNGKAYTKPAVGVGSYGRTSSFNSLQTGKHIQRGIRTQAMLEYSRTFQFPSNGKPYTKKTDSFDTLIKDLQSFNSLQTGNHIQRKSSRPRNRIFLSRFNSLQTGKHIQSYEPHRPRFPRRNGVSIPFKRESISKVKHSVRWGTLTHNKFQFPSNGKPYTKE